MPALQVVETPEQLGAREVDADLFEGLALGGVPQALVGAFDAAARKRHVPRPRISRAARALDEQHLGSRRRGPEHHRDCGVIQALLVDEVRLVGGHRGADAGEIDHDAQDSPAHLAGRR